MCLTECNNKPHIVEKKLFRRREVSICQSVNIKIIFVFNIVSTSIGSGPIPAATYQNHLWFAVCRALLILHHTPSKKQIHAHTQKRKSGVFRYQ